MKLENGKSKMKAARNFLLALVLPFCLAMTLTSCADEDGLHDQNALQVTFEFTGFGDDISGSYSIPGNFDSWDNTTADVSLSKGAGTSEVIAISDSNIQFSLCPVGEWTRPWYIEGAVEGNGSDGGKMWNFYIDDLDLDAGEVTILVDASSGTAVPVVK